MSEFFKMPKLGMDMEEGSIVKWLKSEGDPVEKGEPLAEVETDKSSVEVESPASGIVLKLYCEEGVPLPCGSPAAFIGAEGDAIPDISADSAPTAGSAAQPAPVPPVQEAAVPAAPAQEAPAQVPAVSTFQARPLTPVPASLTAGGRLRATPRARRLAEKHQIDLCAVAGTGPAGRIVEADVRAYLSQGGLSRAVRRIRSETVTPLTGVRKITARRMRQSLSETAQTNHRVDVDVSNLLAFRKQVNARLENQGVKISIVDILAAACAKTLTEFPEANASLLPDGLHVRNYVNIGIAADTPRGLVVPVIQDADTLSLPDLARRSRALIEKARTGTLLPDDMSGGTFTISNLGMYELDSFTAVLNPPETCILAVGRIADRVVAENGQAVIRPMMNLCLTYDHQVLDGAPAARMLQTIKHYIENPVWLLL